MEKTAVEWLLEKIILKEHYHEIYLYETITNETIEQAKEMQKDQKYTEADMLHCWNTLMVAMTHNNPIFFKDYINSLNK